MKRLSRGSRTHFLYEATVGAGLPVIQTLKDLVETGDEIRSISGIFSGTLAYLFNLFDGTRPFSEIVREAKAKGYTEPDPRDDLSGTDVARKAVILAREAGLTLELARHRGREPRAGRRSRNASVDEFLKRLPDFDAPMAERVAGAKRAGQVLRYVATIDVRAGKAKVGLESFAPKPSVREHQPHRQHRAVRDGPLLRQSADHPRPGRGPGRDGGRHLCGSAAALQHAVRQSQLPAMRYLSTRGGQEAGLVDAVMRGLAADGGLFVPDELPRFDPAAVRRRVARRDRGRGARAVLRRAPGSSASSAPFAAMRSISRCR